MKRLIGSEDAMVCFYTDFFPFVDRMIEESLTVRRSTKSRDRSGNELVVPLLIKQSSSIGGRSPPRVQSSSLTVLRIRV